MKTVGEQMKTINSARIEMFHKIPLFVNWNLAQLASLYKHFQRMDLVYNTSVYKKGQQDDSIFIVLKGEVEVNYIDTAPFHRNYRIHFET